MVLISFVGLYCKLVNRMLYKHSYVLADRLGRALGTMCRP